MFEKIKKLIENSRKPKIYPINKCFSYEKVRRKKIVMRATIPHSVNMDKTMKISAEDIRAEEELNRRFSESETPNE